MKTTFDLDSEPTDKTRSIVNDVGRALIKKGYSCLDQRKLIRLTTQINQDLYLREKECKDNLLQGIQSANCLKTRVQAKNTYATKIKKQPKKMR